MFLVSWWTNNNPLRLNMVRIHNLSNKYLDFNNIWNAYLNCSLVMFLGYFTWIKAFSIYICSSNIVYDIETSFISQIHASLNHFQVELFTQHRRIFCILFKLDMLPSPHHMLYVYTIYIHTKYSKLFIHVRLQLISCCYHVKAQWDASGQASLHFCHRKRTQAHLYEHTNTYNENKEGGQKWDAPNEWIWMFCSRIYSCWNSEYMIVSCVCM